MGPELALNGFPLAALAGFEQSVNHPHVADRVVQSVRQGDRALNGLGKCVALQCVHVACRQRLGHRRGTAWQAGVVQQDAGCATQRGVERDFELQSLLRANDLHTLVGHGLGRHGEVQPASTAKVGNCAHCAVGLKVRVAVHAGLCQYTESVPDLLKNDVIKETVQIESKYTKPNSMTISSAVGSKLDASILEGFETIMIDNRLKFYAYSVSMEQ